MGNGFVTEVERARRRRRRERKGEESERRDGPEDGKLARTLAPRSIHDGDATDVVVRAGR